MKKPIYIYGAGGLGREVLALINALDNWTPAGFIDDALPVNTMIKGIPVLGGIDFTTSLDVNSSIVIAIGDPKLKERIINSISGTFHFPTLIHPRAILQESSSISFGEGCIITAGTILTTDIKIGNHVLINLNTTIGHDAILGDYCSVMPGVNIAGGVTLGHSVLVGSGVNIINCINIGSGVRIGMGSVVLRDVDPNLTVVGIPAKPINI